MGSTPITRWFGWILISLYLISGATSLAYEILWSRMLSLQFGVSIFGVVATVTAYMAGLGLGSLLGTHWSRHTRYPLRFFALLELSVALTALAIPSFFQILDNPFAALMGNTSLGGWLTLQISVVILVLMIPALAMGAGFPLVLSAVQNTRVTFGGIYGINAIGGAVGALLPLWLLPWLGWLSSLQAIALLGIAIAGAAFWLSWRYEVEHVPVKVETLRPPWLWMLAYGGIGAGALLLQIGWTRQFGMIMLRTEYVLAIILAVFLLGIGVGSLVARYLTRNLWFTVLPVIAGSFAILGLWCLPALSAWVERAQFVSLSAALWLEAGAVASLTLPVTLVLGAWLPLLAARLDHRYQSGVWLYGANSLGAALGALLAGFVLIPNIGTSATIVLGGLSLLILGLIWGHSRLAWLSVLVVGSAALPVLQMPSVSTLMPQAYGDARQLSLQEDAISITHVVERADGQRQLLADLRRMDASSEPTAVVVQMNQSRLPLLLHPQPRSVLFLGLGTGISAAGSLPLPGLVRTAVELSSGAIAAARHEFRSVNGGVTEHMRIVRDDARRFLIGDRGLYDVVIGDLFHPDLVGRSALLSRQQFLRVHKRLAPGGVFVQWLALNQFDVDSLQVVLQTFRSAFPDGLMFVDAFRLAMVGVKPGGVAGGVNSRAMFDNLARLDASAANELSGGEGPWTWLGRYWGRLPDLDTPLQDEWAPVIEYQLPAARYSGGLDLSRMLSWLLSERPSLKQAAAALQVDEVDFSRFEGAYAATELAHRSWVALLQGRVREGQRLLPLAYQANPRDRWIGFALADAVLADRATARARGLSERQLLKSVLRVRPDHTEALRGLWHLAKTTGDVAEARRYRDRLAALSPLDAELRRELRDGFSNHR
jgi:spermidine synthase